MCGNTKARCNPPGYAVEYHAGVAIQYFGEPPAPGTNCTDNLGNAVVCTRDCEVLGIGVPTMKLYHPKNPYMGVNVTHYGVPSLPSDPFQCPFDPMVRNMCCHHIFSCGCRGSSLPEEMRKHAGSSGTRSAERSLAAYLPMCLAMHVPLVHNLLLLSTLMQTGAPEERQVTIVVKCNRKAIVKPIITFAGEEPARSCKYVIVMESFYGCGCEPYCGGRNCGSDGCFGFCGSQQSGGACPKGYSCVEETGVCCAPDCRGRACGGDGCGGSCGECSAGSSCNRYQQCVSPSTAPAALPSPLPPVTVSTTSGGDKFAAFMGGAVAAGVVGLGVNYALRLRAAA